jgi:hypothetical protein
MLMFTALHTAALVDPSLARSETRDVPDSLIEVVRERLRAAPLRPGVDPHHEAVLLVAAVPGLGQSVLDGTLSADHAFELLDYAIDRALV